MATEIVTYNESLIGEAIRVFNRENEGAEHVVPLSDAIFREQVASKETFSPDGCFLAMEKGRALGLALTSVGPNDDLTEPDPEAGVIDGLFFPLERLDVGEELLRRCMGHLRSRGAKRIYGFASVGGYPFWRGLYMGAEPVCLTSYVQAWATFMAFGFRHHQQSLNYLGEPVEMPYRGDIAYEEAPLDVSSTWARNSWKGLAPRLLRVRGEDSILGDIGWVQMPHLSEHAGCPMAGIYQMWVAEGSRRQGIATSLMGKLFEILGGRGVRRVLVGTAVNNTAARRTYEKALMKVVSFRTGTMWAPHP